MEQLVSQALIVVIGSINLDLTLRVARLPRPGETLIATSLSRTVGGKGANQASAIARLNGAVEMIGAIGTDQEAEILRESLRTSGVGVDGIMAVPGTSGLAMVVVDDLGENCILYSPGANHCIERSKLSISEQTLASASFLLTQLEMPPDIIEEVCDRAAQHRTPLMLDPAPARELPRTLLEKITWFTPNESEASYYLGKPVPDTENLRQYAEELQNLGPANVLLKLGSKGACLLTKEGCFHYVAAPTVRAVDPTAAGDTLNAAFALALSRGDNLLSALRFAVAASALSVTKPGASASMPTLEEVLAFQNFSV